MGLTSLEATIKCQAKKRHNAHFMLIDGMSKVMTQKVKYCESLDFQAFGLKWKFDVRSDIIKDHLSSFLAITDEQYCTGSNWGVGCSFKLSVVSPTGGRDICMTYELNFDSQHLAWGAKSFISHEVLKEKFLVDDKAVFCAEITQVKPNRPKSICPCPTIGTAERLKVIEVPHNKSKFTWKITHFSSIHCEKRSPCEYIVGPRRWYLEMYPKGYLEGKGNSLSLFLHASDFVSNVPVKATTAIYKLRVLDQNNNCNHHERQFVHRFTSNGRWGCRKFLPLEKLNKANGFLVNDQIQISVEFLFVSTHEDL